MTRLQSHLRGALITSSVFVAGALSMSCTGPASSTRPIPLRIDEERLVVEWQDGPRRDAAEAEMRREAKRIARRLFRGQPMPATVRGSRPDPKPEAPSGAAELAAERPGWADGVPEPPPALEYDLPKAWPVEVRRGETPALLAKWAGSDAHTLLTDNTDSLGKRRWLRVGDRLMVTMSANQKVAFDEAREEFQRDRLDAYFSKRYFERVVVYRVKRGEYVANAAKRYGDVPQWLLEEFNQMDFRTLQPGDEILIPVVATFEPGQKTPPPMRVVDEEGRPLTDDHKQELAGQLRPKVVGLARMALDDSNVFERGDGVFSDANQALLPDYLGVRTAPAPGGAAAADPVGPRPPAMVARDIIVKPGETLLHYVEWAGVTMDAIRKANPQLNPDRILVGSRIGLPLTDQQYVAFIRARRAWADQGGDPPAARAKVAATEPKPAASGKTYTVRAGDTAGAIAKRHGTTLGALRAANGGVAMELIRVGQVLALP